MVSIDVKLFPCGPLLVGADPRFDNHSLIYVIGSSCFGGLTLPVLFIFFSLWDPNRFIGGKCHYQTPMHYRLGTFLISSGMFFGG